MPSKKKAAPVEPDQAYLLKVVLYLFLGLVWVRLHDKSVLPLGLIVGLFFASHDHFSIDRRIEYVILILAALLGFIGYGLFINIYGVY